MEQNNKTAAGTRAAGEDGPWLVGDRMTIADLASFSWVNWDVWAGVDVKQFKLLSAWSDRINARPAVKKGLDVPEPFEMKKKMQTKEGEEEYQKMHAGWVMKGQDADAEKNK